jgi:glycerate-2-kinase
VLTLTLSDILGDRIDVIASGPMAPGNAGFCEASKIIAKFGLRYKVPEEVRALIERGVMGLEPETAKSSEACFDRTRTVIIGGAAQSLFAAAARAKAAGYDASVMLNELPGTPNETARVLAKKALRIRDGLHPGERKCLLFGETAEGRRDTGKEGRNHDLPLAFAREIAGIPGITMLSGSTRRSPGTPVVVDGSTTAYARTHGFSSLPSLGGDDYRVFVQQAGFGHSEDGHATAAPAGTVAMDLHFILVET